MAAEMRVSIVVFDSPPPPSEAPICIEQRRWKRNFILGLISGKPQEELWSEKRFFPQNRAKANGFKQIFLERDSRESVGEGLSGSNSAGTLEAELVAECFTTYGPFNLLSVNHPGHGRTAIGLRIHTSRSTSSSLRLWPWMCSSKGKDVRAGRGTWPSYTDFFQVMLIPACVSVCRCR